jgi:hypothetical protein
MDQVSTLESDIEKKIGRIRAYIESGFDRETKVNETDNESLELINRLQLENNKLKEQLSVLKENHEKDLQDLNELLEQLNILMEEGYD